MTKLQSESDQAHHKVTNLPPVDAGDSDQAKQLLDGLKKQQVDLIKALKQPMALAELIERLGVGHKSHFRNKHLKPLMQEGVVAQTHPETPYHQDQAYYLTDLGLAIQQALIQK